MEDYKNTPEWCALNRIWKSYPQELRVQREVDFRLLSDFIKQEKKVKTTKPRKTTADEHPYLNSLSEECITFVLSNKPNLYHSFMAILDNRNFTDCDELLQYYMNKYKKSRPYLVKNQSFVAEVANLCWRKYYKEGYYYTK